MISLTLVRRIAARPSIVFNALVTPEGIGSWWGPDEGPVLIAETDVRVGGAFRVRFRMLDGTEHESCGVYVEVVQAARLVMTWRWTHGGEPDEGAEESRVEIDLRPIVIGTEIGTELTFTHARLRTESSLGSHTAGWNGALDKLGRHLLRLSEGSLS